MFQNVVDVIFDAKPVNYARTIDNGDSYDIIAVN